MNNSKDYVSFLINEQDTIKNFIAQISVEMFDYINNNPTSKFVLFYKYLTHSDLGTFGKATRLNCHEDNLLYYITETDMKNIENKTGKPFQTAHQSSIGLKSEFYDLVGLPQPRIQSRYAINDYSDVKIVNSNMKYISPFYTQKIFQILGKNPHKKRGSDKGSWDFSKLNVNLGLGQFTDIDLHVAVHGLGMEKDEEFHKIRHHLFKGDTLILLHENKQTSTKSEKNNLFILIEKNPIFFSIIGEINQSYEEFQKKLRERLINKTLNKTNATAQLDDDVTRQQQAAWRKMLAKEMKGYSADGEQVICPFTWISADFEDLGALFVASHIKGFSDPFTTNEEKYDINNGLLLSANADALFDRHLISVNEKKELVISYLLESDPMLKSRLLLSPFVFQPIFNDQRMVYLKYHHDIFLREERKRQK